MTTSDYELLRVTTTNWKPFDFLGGWRLSFQTDLVRIIFPKEIIRKIKYSAFIFRFYHYWNILFFLIPPEQGRIFHIHATLLQINSIVNNSNINGVFCINLGKYTWDQINKYNHGPSITDIFQLSPQKLLLISLITPILMGYMHKT